MGLYTGGWLVENTGFRSRVEGIVGYGFRVLGSTRMPRVEKVYLTRPYRGLGIQCQRVGVSLLRKV